MAENCPICKRTGAATDCGTTGGLRRHLKCRICGEFEISTITEAVESHVNESHYLLSSFIRRKTDLEGKIFAVVNDIKLYEKDIVEPTINEQIDYLLDYMNVFQKSKGQYFPFDLYFDYPLFFCKNLDEFNFLLVSMKELKLIKTDPDAFDFSNRNINASLIVKCKITYQGILRLYEIQQKNIESLQCFVAMSFDKSRREIFDKGIKPAVESKELGTFKAYRVDEDRQNMDKIDNKIISEIRKSRFMIADFTGNSPNVYYEVGYAMGFDIPVIFTCKEIWYENTIEHKFKDSIGFDTRQYPFIVYGNYDNLIQELKDKLGALTQKKQIMR